MAKMEKWQSGDKRAFEQVYNCYNKMVFKNAYLITGSRDLGEDIVQEVFVAAWKFRASYDSRKGRLATWLHRITVNECYKKMRAIYVYDCLEDTDFPEVTSRQPEEVLVTKQEYDEMLKALGAMDEKQRTILVLKYLNDLSYAEIADIMQLPIGTVRSRLSRATKALREQVNRSNV